MNKTFILTVLLAFVAISDIQAQKFGFLNTEELLAQLPEMEAANVTMEAYRDSLSAVGQTMVAILEAKYVDLNNRASQLSPNQQQEEVKLLKDEEQKILEFEQKSQQMLYLKSEELINPVQIKVNNAIQEVAKEGGYTYIFDASLGNVLYADATINVIDHVMAKLK